MRTLQIKGGDIQLGPGGYALLTGEDKLKQDLALALIEEVNTDRFHPKWGSTLPMYIGSAYLPETSALIKGEVSRVVANYISRQQREIQSDTIAQKKSRFTDAEIVVSLDAVDLVQQVDRIHIRVSLTTRTKAQVVVVQTVGG